jgi:hypothetical protein
VFKIIGKKFNLTLLNNDAADMYRQAVVQKAEEEQGIDSDTEHPVRMTPHYQASINSQCARLRIATAFAVPEDDSFYALAKSLEFERGTFASDAKVEQELKSSLTRGLTGRQLKAKIVTQAKQIAELDQRQNHWYEKSERLEALCKRAKLIPSDNEEEEDMHPFYEEEMYID